MNQGFESFNDEDDEWLSELETRAIDLEKDLFDWRESRTRETGGVGLSPGSGARPE